MDVEKYIMKIGGIGIQYSTDLKRFLAVTCSTQFKEADIVTLSNAGSELQFVNQQQLAAINVNTGNIIAGERGIAAQNISGSTIPTGDNNVQQVGFYQVGQQVDTQNNFGAVNTGGGTFNTGTIQGGVYLNRGDFIARDKITHNVVLSDEAEGGDDLTFDPMDPASVEAFVQRMTATGKKATKFTTKPRW
jgi:hypothetical protein